jgi:hypothetical protein
VIRFRAERPYLTEKPAPRRQGLTHPDRTRQVAAFQVSVTVLNGSPTPALGTPIIEASGEVCPGKGHADHHPFGAPDPDLRLAVPAHSDDMELYDKGYF